MRPPKHLRPTDLRGAARLAVDATAALTDLVEAMHQRIARLPGTGVNDGRTGGITGLVYQSVRGVTRLVGGSVDALLGLLAPALAKLDATPEGSTEREAVLAALNGVLGDHLLQSANPLATVMSFRRGGEALQLNQAALAAQLPQAGTQLLVLIHGLCMNELQWQRDGHDHGAALARDLGFTPVYVRYNSGQHISTNGRELAPLLQQLLAAWPQPVQRLVLMGHSMGGLVARSAVHHAALDGLSWPAQLHDLVCLGSPHHGAPLERAGHWVDIVLGATPYAAPLARLAKVRSAGITDLRHGYLVDADWADSDRFARTRDRGQIVPLPSGVSCFAAAACIGTTSNDVKSRLLGDGLVPLDSALGRHTDPACALGFEAQRQWVGHGMSHLGLLSRPEVYAQLCQWLRR